MDKAARLRWVILLSALVATVVAILLPEQEEAEVAVRPGHRFAAAGNSPLITASVAQDDADTRDDGSDADPFAPRGWQPPPPLVAALASTAPLSVAPVDIAPPGPPPLPFRFVGSFADGSEQLVYLARGEQALVAHSGDVLDSIYKVMSIGPTKIEFEHIPTSTKQTLAIPARDN
ncbi:hypothetical protein ACEN9F_03425 [Duganella sp. CT11-25]|uniref:hypothetical protein n=1 Tax=unclassified Duganella TaxID=2636909 RepID=UPI0039AEAE43